MKVEVVIVGSGAGGAMAASKLTSLGYEVVVLEEGRMVSKEDFDQDEGKLVKLMYRRGGALATDDMSIRILQGRVYGGSTTINWMNCFRTPEDVLEEWRTEHSIRGYSVDDLGPYFEAIESRMDIHEVTQHNRANSLLAEGCKKLGWHFANCRNNSRNCIGCGKCGLGCYYDAKMDMRMTYLEHAVKSGAKIYTSTKAVKIKSIDSDRQKVYTNNPEIPVIESKRTIVAGSAIMTPLLLQKSGVTSKNLGKYLHLHPVAASIGVYEDAVNPTYGIPMSVHSKEHWKQTGSYGVWQEVPDLEVFLAGVNMPGLGEERRSLMQQINNSSVILTLTRDGASRKSSGEVRWKRGLNLQGGRFSLQKLPSIRYRVDPLDKKHMLAGLRAAIQIHLAAGAKEVVPMHSRLFRIKTNADIPEFFKLPMGPNYLSMFSAHPTGTARMGGDPSRSVVAEDLSMYGRPGIFIMDGSVLPTAPGVNPMETILAVVARGIDLGSW